MSRNFFKKRHAEEPREKWTWRTALKVLGLPAWVFFGFMLAQALAIAAIAVMNVFNVPLEVINESVFNTAGAAVIYVLAIVLVIGIPWLVRKSRTSLEEVGLQRLPGWLDLLWGPVGYVAYAIVSVLLTTLAAATLTFVDFEQVQDTGFSNLTVQFEYLLAFFSLVVVAPVAEEILFRGYLLGKLRKLAPVWVAILITSLLFAIVHFAWNVGIDVFALSIILCLLRIYTGSLWPSIILHMIKNGIAYYFLFINPVLSATLGG